MAWGLRLGSIAREQYLMLARSLIAVLFCPRRPFAILWGIPFVVVNALYRQFRIRAFAHIGDEVLEVSPTFAHLNPTSTVVFERFIFRICTTLNHSRPDIIFRYVRLVMGTDHINLEATATLGIAIYKRRAGNHWHPSAFAEAKPENASLRILSNGPLCSKTPESFPGKISDFVAIRVGFSRGFHRPIICWI